jgi:ATP-dependent DNA ligase
MAGPKPAIGVIATMTRTLRSPFPPMEALSVDAVPVGTEWQYEPKWDGFRCLVFRRGDAVTLQSKSGKPLTRYFPDVVEAVRRLKSRDFVLDGEIVVPEARAFSFDALLQRIHPAASRVRTLATETPALLIAFDLLSEGDDILIDRPLQDRRKRLEAFARRARCRRFNQTAITRRASHSGGVPFFASTSPAR